MRNQTQKIKPTRVMWLYRVERTIPNITVVLVGFITCFSFMLSFFNLMDVAIKAGFNPLLAWAWPLCLDCLLISGSLVVLRASLKNEPTYVGWLVVGVFTTISTIFNISNGSNDLLSQVAHAMPPLSLMVSIELLVMVIKSDLIGAKSDFMGATKSKRIVEEEEEESTSIVEDVELKLKPIVEEVELKLIAKAVESKPRKNYSEMILGFFRDHPLATNKEAANSLGVLICTVDNHIQRALAAGIITRVGGKTHFNNI